MKRLILFDIDGTLIRPITGPQNLSRFPHAIRETFGLEVNLPPDPWPYNGWSDRAILWALLDGHGIAKGEFLDRIGVLSRHFVEYFTRLSGSQALYERLPGALALVEAAVTDPDTYVGMLTGNLYEAANWKLVHCGFEPCSFGAFGNEADDRSDLARLIIPKARIYFGWEPKPSQIYVLGDTVHDITCARAIGANVVIVRTGWNVNQADIDAGKPDLVVPSLHDRSLYDYLELPFPDPDGPPKT